MQAQMSPSNKKVLAILYTTALSQLNCLKQVLGATVVVDFQLYLDTVLENFKKFKEKQAQFVTQEERDQYDKTFNKKIEQAMKFIDETVNPAIDDVEKEVKSTSNDLLTTVVHQEAEAKNNVEQAKIRVQRMKETMVMRHVFSALKIGASVVSMLGPQGAAIGGAIGTAASIGEQFVVGSNIPKSRAQLPLPPSVGKYALNMEAKMKSWNEGKMKELDVLLETTKKAIGENKVAMEDVKKNVDELQKSVDEYEANKKDKDILTYLDRKKKIEEHEKNLKDVLEKKKVELEDLQKGTETQKQKAKEYGDKALKAIGYIKSAITNTAELGYELYNTIKNDEVKMNELSDEVEKAKQDVEKLQKYKAAITETLEPLVSSIATDLQGVTENLGGKSAVALQVQKWQVKQKLTEFKDFLQDFSEGYAEAKKFSQAVDKLSEGVTLIIDLYDFIEKYHDQMEFANYLANINSPDALNLVIGNEDGVVSYINKVQVALQASILLSQFERTVQTFRQWVFPYAQIYENDFNTKELPNYLDPTSSITSPKEIELFLVDFLGDKVTHLRSKIKEYESTAVGAIDDTLKQTVFNSDSKSTLPFYSWKAAGRENSDRDVIKQLFSGEKVFISVSPDFSYSRGRAAVKFQIAEFQPNASDRGRQAKLKDILDEIKVEMTHSGASRYMFDDKSFEMVGDNVTLKYNFERDPNTRERIETNLIYKKVKQGDFILSPFTMWAVQFLPATGRNRLSELVEMAEYVDLELIGSGSYVDEWERKNENVRRISFYEMPMPLHFTKFEVSSTRMLPTSFY